MISRFRRLLDSFTKRRQGAPARPRRQSRRRLEVEGLEERALLSTAAIPDMLTPREHLASVTGADGRIYAIGGFDTTHHAVNTVEAYDPRWWDGQARVACLVVRGGRRMRRMRVIETAGVCLVVPFSRRLAHRWLAARRRPRSPELGGPGRRTSGGGVVLDASSDAVRCATRGCAALLPLAYPGCCPVCGG